MPVINVSDKLTGEVLEQHQAEIGTNLLAWLSTNIDGFEPREHPPISIALNGKLVLQRQWSQVKLRTADIVTIYPEPKDPGTIGTLVLKAVIAYGVNYLANKLLAPKIPDNYNSTAPQGSSIYSANAQGNQPRLNGIIPEVFGQHPVYPDYLFQPWREYVNNEEYLNIGLSVGAGYYGLPAGYSSIRIGNTPIINYLDYIEVALYNPGEPITSVANRIMYMADEVGGTSNAQGLELKRNQTVTATMPANCRFKFAGNAITAWLETVEIKRVANGMISTDDGPKLTYTDIEQLVYVPVDWSSSGFSSGLIEVIGTGVYDGTYTLSSTAGNTANVAASFVETSYLQGTVSQVDSAESTWLGWYSATPSGTTTESIWVDLLFKGGVGRLENNGSISALTILHELQWRVKGSDTVTTVTLTTTGNSFNDHAHSQQILISPAAEIECRMRRITATSADSSVRGEAVWQRLRALMPSPASYPSTTLFLRIKGTDALAVSAENTVNLDVIRQLPVLQAGGVWSSNRIGTRQISAVVGQMARSLQLEDKIDTAKLWQLEQIWSARGDWFDGVFDNDSTFFESLKRVLAVGYTEPTISDGKISFVRDAKYPAGVAFDGQMFTWDNIIKMSENGTLFDPDEPDGVRVEYFDPVTRKPAYVDCLLPGDVGVLTEDVRAFGITDKTKAWRFGMRLRRAKRYQRTLYSITTELEGLNSKVGEICTLPGRGSQHGWLTGYNKAASRITINSPLEWGDGAQYMRIRLPDGTGSYTTRCTRIDDYTIFLVDNVLYDAALDFDGPGEPPLFAFGSLGQIYKVAKLKTVSPGAGEEVGLELVNYDERVYADDDNAPI